MSSLFPTLVAVGLGFLAFGNVPLAVRGGVAYNVPLGKIMLKTTVPLATAFLLAHLAAAQETGEPKMGHSRMGSAFDAGLRTRPWVMGGIGKTHFKITTANPEVQFYFDQGNTLLHNFWWEEAERSFRWCLKLEPEHPMAYWGLALTSNYPGPRQRAFLKEAVKRKHRVSERERAFIEAWEEAYKEGGGNPDSVLRRKLQDIILRYPDDVEAKARLAWVTPERGNEVLHALLVKEIQRQNPLHPGAIHSNIHAWDYVRPEQAIESALTYAKAAPQVGHAQHMPGHIFSKIGMWHEAARAMDTATRVELRYLNERYLLPHETWNYQHNRNYLSYIQEQLGMAELALQGARDLLASPTDPGANNESGGGFVHQGREALIRGCLKFERYDELLAPGALPFGTSDMDQAYKGWVETLALVGKGGVAEARTSLDGLKAHVAKVAEKNKGLAERLSGDLKFVEYRVLNAEEKRPEALALLKEVEERERREREGSPYAGDPPADPWTIARIYGDELLADGDLAGAIASYMRGLRYEPNDAFCFAGLARAHAKAGELEKARHYAGRLEAVWSSADPGLRWLRDVRSLNLGARPLAVTPHPERPYRPSELARFGPSGWTPFPAPKLECLDSQGKRVALTDLKGRNVLLVFYLGDTCVHCVEQLQKINDKIADFEKLNTVVLAVSSAAPEYNRESLKVGSMKLRLLSDKGHENARRFLSYDDFEDMELHSTSLIDAQGRVRWKKTGGDPFMNVDFLLREIARWGKG